MRSSRSIQLLFLGSALAILGCGGNQQANAKKPCPPRPDGTPDPACSGSSRSTVRTGGLIVIPGGGGGSAAAGGAKSGLSSSPGGAKAGGFGGTGGSSPSASS